jgi:hypothetical protein
LTKGAIVVALWRLKVANSLTVAVSRRRIDVEFRRAALADLRIKSRVSKKIPVAPEGKKRTAKRAVKFC